MNDNEFDLAARAWLDDGPTRMSDRAMLSALEGIHTTRQRRPVWPAWRATPVSIFARVAAAAVLVVSVSLLAINVVPRQPDGPIVGGPPTPTPSPALDFPDLTTTFVSPRNGFSIKHPDRVSITAATDLWQVVGDEGGSDVIETGLAAVFRGASMAFRDHAGFRSFDEGVDDILEYAPGGCRLPRSQQPEITIDGRPGRISESCPNEIQATVNAEDLRLYVFTLSHDRTDARAVFDTFAATIDLTPETAVDYPNMATRPTFVSPTYGFSFKYVDRGGLTPAKGRWDPVNQQVDVNFDDRFDAVETGLSAYFEAASAEIPAGVSIDAWVDDYVMPGGCSGGRTPQQEITIDGQSGRISECRGDRIDATVVAGGRVYLFTLVSSRPDARAFFDAWVATIDLRPEDAAPPSSTP
jgi:hypothetical protein